MLIQLIYNAGPVAKRTGHNINIGPAPIPQYAAAVQILVAWCAGDAGVRLAGLGCLGQTLPCRNK